jgi:hypothetical protein
MISRSDERESGKLRADDWARAYARWALAAAFLSAVAGRFGLWQGGFDLHASRTSSNTPPKSSGSCRGE